MFLRILQPLLKNLINHYIVESLVYFLLHMAHLFERISKKHLIYSAIYSAHSFSSLHKGILENVDRYFEPVSQIFMSWINGANIIQQLTKAHFKGPIVNIYLQTHFDLMIVFHQIHSFRKS